MHHDPTPLDEIPRYELAARLAGEVCRLVNALASGPAGRHLRRATDAEGVPLLACAEVGEEVVWVSPALVDLIRGLRATTPRRTCDPCQGPYCPRCRGAGYLPADPKQLANAVPQKTIPVCGDVADVWGWVNHGRG